MPVPIQNVWIVPQGQARLTSAFITQPNVRTWLAALLQPWQDLENATFAVLEARFLATATCYTLPATNSVFDSIGSIVGLTRNGLSDYNYQSLLFLQIAVLRSTGRTTDWSNFGAILLRTSTGPVTYLDANPIANPVPQLSPGDSSFMFSVYDLGPVPSLIAAILAGACPNGIRGTLCYTIWPFTSGANGDLICGSVYDTTAGNGSLGSTYTSTAGGGVATCIDMN